MTENHTPPWPMLPPAPPVDEEARARLGLPTGPRDDREHFVPGTHDLHVRPFGMGEPQLGPTEGQLLGAAFLLALMFVAGFVAGAVVMVGVLKP